MAYTNVWNESAPADTDDADLLGQDIRTFKVDVRDRINTIIGAAPGTPLADPIIGVQSRTLWVPGNLIITTGTTPTKRIDRVSFAAGDDGKHVFYYPKLPVGAIITGMNFWLQGSTSADAVNVTISNYISPSFITTAIATCVATLTSSIVSYPAVGSGGALPYTVVAGFLGIDVTLSVNTVVNIYGIEILYTVANPYIAI